MVHRPGVIGQNPHMHGPSGQLWPVADKSEEAVNELSAGTVSPRVADKSEEVRQFRL